LEEVDTSALMAIGLGETVAEAFIVAVTPASARAIAGAYGCWGKAIHPAAPNFRDCFAVEVH